MLVRGAFNHLLRPGLRRDFRDEYQSHPVEYDQFLKTGTQDRAEVEAVALSNLPRMVRRGEVEPITFLDPTQSDKVTYIDDEYALGFAVSRRLMEDDLYMKANQNAKWLGRSARLTQEYAGSNLLDDAFAGSVFTGLQGESLISATHTFLAQSGTWSNKISGDPQLGVAGLEAAFDTAEDTRDHNGDPVPIQLMKLVINISDEWMAIKLMNSQLEPFTSDNQINAFKIRQAGMSYAVSHYKEQSGNDWFTFDPMNSDAHFLFRINPEFDDEYDFKTKAALYTARQRINVYFFDQRGWIGSDAA